MSRWVWVLHNTRQKLKDTVSISHQEIHHSGQTRGKSQEGTLDFYHYKVTGEDRSRLVSLISNMQDVVRANIRSAVERSSIQTKTNPKEY